MARTLNDYFAAFERASLPVSDKELDWDTTAKREVLTSIRQWIREGMLNSGIPYPVRLQHFALTHRRDITVYLTHEPTHWQVHWYEQGSNEQSSPLSDPACWPAVRLIPYEAIAWDTWQLAAENGWLAPDIDFDIST